MVPTSVVVIDALTLTAHGKVNRSALPTSDDGHSEGRTIIAPRTELEELIAATWRDVLGIREVGVQDSFFDLGGHSMLLLKVHGRLCQRLQRDLSVLELFEHPTVASLALHLRGDRPGQSPHQDDPRRTSEQLAGKKRLQQQLARRRKTEREVR